MLFFRYGCNWMFGEMGDVLAIRILEKYEMCNGFWVNNNSFE